MDLLQFSTDTIAELLTKIIEFINARHDLLARNLRNIHIPGFEPKDLPVKEFCTVLNNAIAEYIRHYHFILRDTRNIKFCADGTIKAEPVCDKHAKQLLGKNLDKYLDYQKCKLSENSLNKKLAKELLKQRQREESDSGQSSVIEVKSTNKNGANIPHTVMAQNIGDMTIGHRVN